MRLSMKPALYQDFFPHMLIFFYRNAFLFMKLSLVSQIGFRLYFSGVGEQEECARLTTVTVHVLLFNSKFLLNINHVNRRCICFHLREMD